MNIPDRLLTTSEAAEILGCNPETIRRAIRRKDLACHKLYGCVRIAPEHLTAYLNASLCPARDQIDLTSNGATNDGASSGGTAANVEGFQQARRTNVALNKRSRTSKPSLTVIPND